MPKTYPPFVTLLRRRKADDVDLGRIDSAALTEWLLTGAIAADDMLDLFRGFVVHLLAAGFPLDRTTLHVGTLHPQILAYAWNWERDQGDFDEVKVAEATLGSDAYRRNPLRQVIEGGVRIRQRTEDAATPLLQELALQGIREYLAMPLSTGGSFHNAVTFATKRDSGFSDADIVQLSAWLKLYALHVQKHIVQQISANVLDVYLGHEAGARVLRGSIKRGAGHPIEAIIWSSDLRGFTALADQLDPPATIAVLNAYFEGLAGAVLAEGGDVLKFIGDGMLAVFRLDAFASPALAAEASFKAAERALADLQALNADPDRLPERPDGAPLRTGIALHLGEVFFGNVGAPERLDFTVIGRAVNTASRVEALSKTLGRPLLITAPVAALLSCPLEPLGEHALRGVGQPLALFAPAASARG
ncbi:MAG: adenylate/guanylate cyclase domain-containing protein [Geminicoccaceae bacterium]